MSLADRTSHSIKNQQGRKRSIVSPRLVRFNQQVRVRNIQSLDELTPQEQLDTWYSSEDYKYIRRREHRLMKALTTHVHISEKKDQEQFCNRVSLEQRVLGLQTSTERDARSQRIRSSQFLVFYEQERFGDPERLARMYSRISLESAQQARDRGLNVEIVLRNLDLSSGITHQRGKSACVGSPSRSGSSNMRYRRWSADTSSNPSLLPVRNTTIVPAMVVQRPPF
jgi:hypothetical protein